MASPELEHRLSPVSSSSSSDPARWLSRSPASSVASHLSATPVPYQNPPLLLALVPPSYQRWLEMMSHDEQQLAYAFPCHYKVVVNAEVEEEEAFYRAQLASCLPPWQQQQLVLQHQQRTSSRQVQVETVLSRERTLSCRRSSCKKPVRSISRHRLRSRY